ncbi:MAG: ribonuclease J, partial [Alphaproteobacteria bacterium]|nr:ribonuclease J [Alphaproteobacteria bacterium]
MSTARARWCWRCPTAAAAASPRATCSSPAPPEMSELLFLPLGGSGEIGMNLNLYGCDGRWLMVDCGVTFPGDDMPGVDSILPDPRFIAERRKQLVGLVLTHGHEDHLGAVAWLWPKLGCPVYATPFTAALLKRKLVERNLIKDVKLHLVEPGKTLKLGPFAVDYVGITHSIPESHSLAIRTRHGTVLHTGDWKLDPEPLVGPPTDAAAFERLGQEGVLALVCDSTNALSPGTSGSEGALRQSLIELVARETRRVCITTFASNVARIDTVAKVAAATGRRLCVVGRSLWRILECARETGYLQDLPELLHEDEVGYLPPGDVLFLVTGCQGEPRGALSRIAYGEHRHVGLKRGDLVIFSSRQIPGNERRIGQVVNRLAADDIRVVTWSDAFVHVSGHPCQDELRRYYAWARPRIAVPVHGEIRHLKRHVELAREAGVSETVLIENGAMVRLAPGPAEIVDRVPSGRLLVEGSRIHGDDAGPLRARKRAAFNGALVAAVALDHNDELAAPVRLSALGLF